MAKKIKKESSDQPLFEGLPIVDGSKDIDLVILPEDIKNSVKKDPNNCAAAMAGRRELHTDVRVYMTRTYIKDKKNERWVRFMTPVSIQKEIVSFDRGAMFQPGEYKLKAPSERQRLGVEREKGKSTGDGTPKKPRRITANVRISALDKVVGAHHRKNSK